MGNALKLPEVGFVNRPAISPMLCLLVSRAFYFDSHTTNATSNSLWNPMGAGFKGENPVQTVSRIQPLSGPLFPLKTLIILK